MQEVKEYQVGINQEVLPDVLIDWKENLRYVRLEPRDARILAEQLVKHAKRAEEIRKGRIS